jgi:hypothetical protein
MLRNDTRGEPPNYGAGTLSNVGGQIMNPFTAFIDWIEDYPEAGMIVAIGTVIVCTIAGIVWGQ